MALVHTALLASVGVYAVVLLFLRSEIAPAAAEPPAGTRLFLVLAALGAAQFAGASVVGRALLRSPRSGAADRVRLYFLLRGAAAEAIALYGFVLGLLGASASQVAALFVLSVAALLLCAPARVSWEEAFRRAQSSSP
jgi:hypothetical protein